MSSLEKDVLCGFDSDRVYELDRLQAEKDQNRLHAAISDHLNKIGIEHKSLGRYILIPRHFHIGVQVHSVQVWRIIPATQPPHPHLSLIPNDPQLLDKIVQWLTLQNKQIKNLVKKLDKLTQSSDS